MTPPIRIQLMTGPQAGLQTTHTEARVSFGREAGNTVVLDDQHLSRRHGELVCVDGHWSVVNLSPNGTSVNGRPVKGAAPKPLRPGDVIGVGKAKLFAVQFQPAAGAAPVEAVQPQNPVDAGNRMSRRGKLWTGIGVYVAAMLAVFVVLMMLRGGGDGEGEALPAQLTDADIARDIQRTIDKPRDERSANENLAAAQQLYPTAGATPAGLYHTYERYKLALAFSGQRKFEGIDQLRYVEVEQRLIEKISGEYRQAYVKADNREWRTAEKALYDLISAYPATDSPVLKHFERLLTHVKTHTKKK